MMSRGGFSLMEMLVVVAIIGVMALMAGPNLMRLAPYQRLRGEVQGAATLMRQARLKAAASQKPARVSVDCSDAPAQPCQLRLEMARFKLGEVVGWTEVRDARRELNAKVAAAPLAPPANTSFPATAQAFGFKQVCDGDPKSPPKPTRAGLSWLIFMPGGHVYSCPRPFELGFYDKDLPGQKGGTAWRIVVNGDSGRTELKGGETAPKLNP